MRLRLAKKIVKTIGTPDAERYSEGMRNAALDRLERTRSNREANTFWHATMKAIGESGRRWIVSELKKSRELRQLEADIDAAMNLDDDELPPLTLEEQAQLDRMMGPDFIESILAERRLQGG